MAPWISKLTLVRYVLIAPFMVMVICFAAFQATRSYNDLLALLAVGILGLFMRRFGWSRPAFLIGFVLSLGAERYLYQAVQFSGWGFFGRPLVLVILALTLLSLWAGLRKSGGGSAINTEGAAEDSRATRMWPQITFALAVLGLFVFTFAEGVKNSYLAMMFPVAVACVGGACALWVLFAQSRGAVPAGSANFDTEARATDFGPWPFVGWFGGFIVLTGLIGFFTALALFFLAFLRVVARCPWWQVLLLSASACGFILVLASSLNLVFPGGVLQSQLDLPWPFR
jgi:hypothetical protein